MQSIYIMENEVLKYRASTADITIAPDVSHIKAFEFYRAAEAIEVGYSAAMEVLPKLKKLISVKN